MAGAASAGDSRFCDDPDLIYAAVIDAERAKFAWLDQYLSGKVAIYQGKWSAEGMISGNGIGDVPLSSRVESTSTVATLTVKNALAWWDVSSGTTNSVDGAFLKLMDTDRQSWIQLVQPTASPSKTYVQFFAYTPDFVEYTSLCAGCVANLTQPPPTIVAQGTLFTLTSGGQKQEVTLNMDLALVPPAQLTGQILITLASDRVWWSLVSGQWIERRGGHYSEPGPGLRGAANYSFEYFIDDANPRQFGVRGFRVDACEEQCKPIEDEGDHCP